MKILIVEDDPASRRLMEAYLTPMGRCDTAADGSAALDCFTAALDEAEPYNLVTLDIMMPGMTGHEVLKTIRFIEEERGILAPGNVKIIMTTALKDSGNIMAAFSHQCEAYLVKPIELTKLMEKVREMGLAA